MQSFVITFHINQVEAVQFHAYDKLCQCQMMTGDTAGSKKSCTEAIRIDDQPRLYCERAEAYLAEDMFDEAIGDYRAALEREEDFSRAKEGMAKAQKLQKQVQTCFNQRIPDQVINSIHVNFISRMSALACVAGVISISIQAGKRDYYKILGVKRTATKKEISKVGNLEYRSNLLILAILQAYKKLAMQWHPDKFQEEEDKKKAEKKFMDIAAAKEVLTDEGGFNKVLTVACSGHILFFHRDASEVRPG